VRNLLSTLTHVLGHSFHIGGAVELLLTGNPTKIMTTTGSWTSLVFLLYWQQMLLRSTLKAYKKISF